MSKCFLKIPCPQVPCPRFWGREKIKRETKQEAPGKPGALLEEEFYKLYMPLLHNALHKPSYEIQRSWNQNWATKSQTKLSTYHKFKNFLRAVTLLWPTQFKPQFKVGKNHNDLFRDYSHFYKRNHKGLDTLNDHLKGHSHKR